MCQRRRKICLCCVRSYTPVSNISTDITKLYLNSHTARYPAVGGKTGTTHGSGWRSFAFPLPPSGRARRDPKGLTAVASVSSVRPFCGRCWLPGGSLADRSVAVCWRLAASEPLTGCRPARWPLTGCWRAVSLAVPAAISRCQAVGWRPAAATPTGSRLPSGTGCLAVMKSVCDPEKLHV